MLLRKGLGLMLVAGTVPAGAAELYSWHSMDTPAIVTKGFEVVAHTRLRSRHELHYLDQVRAGAVFRWNAVPKRFIPYAGAYFQPQQIRSHQWAEGRRLFAGIETPFALRANLSLTTRLAAERFIGTGRPDYFRYRSYERLVIGKGNQRVAPYLQNEWLAVRQGFHSVRNSGGLRVKINDQWTVEGGYLYDIRRTAWGGDRQAIVTAVRYTPKVR